MTTLLVKNNPHYDKGHQFLVYSKVSQKLAELGLSVDQVIKRSSL